MDELESQIREVLGDPAQMAQIMGLAQSLMGGEKPPSPPKPEGTPGKPGALPGGRNAQDERQALLNALRPYLSEGRRRRLERALRITRMAQLAKGALAGLGGMDHA